LVFSNFWGTGLEKPAGLDQLAENVKKESRIYLETKAQELQAERIGNVSYRLMEEAGPVEIIDLARKTPDNMLAMYASEKSRFGRLIVGNVTKRIVRRSEKPVLVVPA
jgi:nucleotide-binding universal stress UspA family protein